jgi:hypothetical protein
VTDTELIDAANKYWLNIGSALTAEDTDVRARTALHATQAVAEFWARPWHWRDASASVTIASTGIGPLPADFGTMSRGFVVNPTNRARLAYLPPQELFRLRESTSGTSSSPVYYTIAGMSAAADPMVKRIHVHPKPPSNKSVTVYYELKRPEVSYGGAGLQSVPEEYHEDVIFRGVVAKLAQDEGDPRAPMFEREFKEAIARAWSESRVGLQQPRRNRGYGSSRWY